MPSRMLQQFFQCQQHIRLLIYQYILQQKSLSLSFHLPQISIERHNKRQRRQELLRLREQRIQDLSQIYQIIIMQISKLFNFQQLYIFQSHKMQGVVLTNQEVKKAWNQMSKIYEQFDAAPQTHFFTLVSLLKLKQAENILEIGCGTGRLLPYALSQKGQQTRYYATDFIENLLEITKKRLETNLIKYESKLTFQEWCKKQHLFLEQHDVQTKFDKGLKFDRIICNLVLMLVNNPQNALEKLFQVASDDCLMGLTIWGDRNKSKMMSEQERILQEKSGIKRRSNFHLFGKIQGMLQRTGWQIILNFEQNSIFPFTRCQPTNKFFFGKFQSLPEDKRKESIEQFTKVIEKLFQDKVGINFSNQVIIARKKK